MVCRRFRQRDDCLTDTWPSRDVPAKPRSLAQSTCELHTKFHQDKPPVRDPILSVQETSQGLASVVLGLLGHAGIRYPIKAVIRRRIYVELDRHPGAA